ncbi:hypothetical protein LZ31DRAFT_636903 [Colletotrichum somersetense]|nr:hypothetical protein LZ31DRAFT_636903 [Colletotrichum somersetense]
MDCRSFVAGLSPVHLSVPRRLTFKQLVVFHHTDHTMASDTARADLDKLVRERLDEAQSRMPADRRRDYAMNAVTFLLCLLDVVVAVADWCIADDVREAAGKEDVEGLWEENNFAHVSDLDKLVNQQKLLREVRDRLKVFSRELRTLVETRYSEINERR